MKSCIRNYSTFKSILKILHVVKQLKEDITSDDAVQTVEMKGKARERRKFLVRDISEKPKTHSEYHHSLPDLLSGDREFCFRYLRMNAGRFEHLLRLGKDK